MIVFNVILNQKMVSYDRINWKIVLVSWNKKLIPVIMSITKLYCLLGVARGFFSFLFFFFLQEVPYLDKLGIYVGWCWTLSSLQTKVKVITASSVHVQISELSLVGFVVGCPFDRRRSAPDVSFQVEQLI